MSEYAGESIAKKVARVRLYLRVKKMRAASGLNHTDRVFIIPGPHASEVGCLRHILQPREVTAMDPDQKGVDALFDKTSVDDFAVMSCTAKVTEEPREMLGCFDFVHLDLMGNLASKETRLAAQFMSQMEHGGVTALTYLRARETGEARKLVSLNKELLNILSHRLPRPMRRLLGHDKSRTMLIMGEMTHATFEFLIKLFVEKKPREGLDINDPEQLSDAAQSFQEFCAAKGHLSYVPILSYAYRGEVSPMGVVGLQLKKGKPTNLYKRVLEGKGALHHRRERELMASIVKKDAMLDLMDEVKELEKMGYDKRAIAEIFDVSIGTMAAWKAHRTMGTYAA